MNSLNEISNNIFLLRYEFPTDIIELVEKCSFVYPFKKVKRRPHLTMELPAVFSKKDSVSAAILRSRIYEAMMPAIRKYFEKNQVSFMYPRKDFITVSKLMPGSGMGPHVDNQNLNSNHFICMMYLNDDYEGGEIAFPQRGIIYKPMPGDILLYKASIEHEVLPVKSGARYSIGYGLTDFGDTIGETKAEED